MAALSSFCRNLLRFLPLSTRTCNVESVRNSSSTANNIIIDGESYTGITVVRPYAPGPHPLWNYNENKYVDAWMLRDVTRRKAHKKYHKLRMRLMAIKRAEHILPREITDLADAEFLEQIPRPATSYYQMTNRCAVTSRSRGVVHRWRLSRFIFRHMVDYNRIAGLQRAMW